MRDQYRASTLSAWGLITGVCLAGSLLTSCSAPDDVQGPSGVAAVDIDIQPSVVPTGGLIGEWKLDGNVNDGTANNFHATLFGNPPYIAAKIGQGLDLTGNGTGGRGLQFVEMPANSTLNDLSEGSAYSISAWFNPASAPSGSGDSQFWMVVGKANVQAIGIAYNMNKRFAARHYLDGNVLKLATATDTFSLNQWHHVVAVVRKGSSTVPDSLILYVNGQRSQTTTWTAGTPAKDFGPTVKWRIGKSDPDWSAHGRVDQVRFYNVPLTGAQVADLYNESGSGSQFRFPVMMTKGQQTELFGVNPMPDAQTSAGTVSRAAEILDAARAADVRVTIRVTGGNEDLRLDSDPTKFSLAKWKAAFDNVSSLNANSYYADGTLIAHFAIDEPFADFPGNMSSSFLEQICQYQKSRANWNQVPCFIRELNTKLYAERPTGGTYQYVDGGWAQIADHHYDTEYDWDIGAYFRTNLAQGQAAGLWLMYGFNLINGGREVSGCAKPADPNHHNCAMSPSEIRAIADTLAAIGNDQGCGVNGWWINASPGAERDYYFGQGQYAGNGIPSALQYHQNRVGGLRPAACDIR